MLLVIFLIIAIPCSVLFWLATIGLQTFRTDYAAPAPWRWVLATIIPVFIAWWGLRRKSLNTSGAAAGLLVGFVITLGNLCFCAALLIFFLAGSKVTKFRSKQKKKLEADFKKGGQRNWVQVVCNGGVAAQFAMLYILESGCVEKPIDFQTGYVSSWFAVAVLGSLSCCCGDTFSSEIGSVVGTGDPWLITSFRKVPRGTNGGISVIGTLSSIFGGLLVGLGYYVTLLFCAPQLAIEDSPIQWPIVFLGGAGGLLGSIVDSVLGATCQYSGYHKRHRHVVEYTGPDIEHISGVQLLDNHSVNLLSSLITGLLLPGIAYHVWISGLGYHQWISATG
ncbi:transmembrane protein 19-like [Gigantopelta aegis]|uniref:transmembrane protein 19-like n=1 Tax=Gigantopelta aegis TaxID=1735272 RepID=UPI001B887838|nr:transmembrane protein 19-like [Gigantopelta aegis]